MSVVKPKKKAAKSKAVKTALVDGLLSDSATHVHMLLQSQDQQLMSDTMQQLALNPRSIDTFLRVLTDLIAKHPQSANRALHWLNRLVETHSGYIVSSPDLTSRLGQLRSQLQLRLASLQRLLMLKGRLDLLLSLHARAAAGADLGADPKLRSAASAVVHQDTDSEVTEAEDDDDDEGEDEEGDDEDEGPDDLAGQLLGNAESGSEAELESGGNTDEGEEDDESDPMNEDGADDDDDLDDEEDDEAEDDEEEEDEDFSDSAEGEDGATVGRVR